MSDPLTATFLDKLEFISGIGVALADNSEKISVEEDGSFEAEVHLKGMGHKWIRFGCTGIGGTCCEYILNGEMRYEPGEVTKIDVDFDLQKNRLRDALAQAMNMIFMQGGDATESNLNTLIDSHNENMR